MTRVLMLVGGSERYHDPIAAGQAISTQLRNRGLETRLSQDAGILGDQRRDEYDVVVYYGQERQWSQLEQQALDAFVGLGKGFVPLHAANVMGPPGQELYQQLVGSAFTGHERFGRITVTSREEHVVTSGWSNFALEDELYLLAWTGAPGRILATGSGGTAVDVPIVYTREHGAGRVCYISLGHDARAWHHQGFSDLLAQAVAWAGSSQLHRQQAQA